MLGARCQAPASLNVRGITAAKARPAGAGASNIAAANGGRSADARVWYLGRSYRWRYRCYDIRALTPEPRLQVTRAPLPRSDHPEHHGVVIVSNWLRSSRDDAMPRGGENRAVTRPSRAAPRRRWRQGFPQDRPSRDWQRGDAAPRGHVPARRLQSRSRHHDAFFLTIPSRDTPSTRDRESSRQHQRKQRTHAGRGHVERIVTGWTGSRKQASTSRSDYAAAIERATTDCWKAGPCRKASSHRHGTPSSAIALVIAVVASESDPPSGKLKLIVLACAPLGGSPPTVFGGVHASEGGQRPCAPTYW